MEKQGKYNVAQLHSDALTLEVKELKWKIFELYKQKEKLLVERAELKGDK